MRASICDAPARPIIRFRCGSVNVDCIAAAPVLGLSLWVGRVPPATEAVSVSPTNTPGPFGFAIAYIRRRSWLSLIADGLRWHRRQARSALLTRLIGWKPESDVNLAWATRSRPLAAYEDWRRCRHRPPNLEGIDRPRTVQGRPALKLVIAHGDDAVSLRRTLASLKASTFEDWSALVIGGMGSSDFDPRAVDLAPGDLPAAIAGAAPANLFSFVAAGDRFPPLALACVAEQAARNPEALLFFGDELQIENDDVIPLLKPGWSPRLESARPYLGRGLFLRRTSDLSAADWTRFCTTGRLPTPWLARLPSRSALPLRRFIVETPKRPPAPITAASPGPVDASVSIVMPTRDQPQRLRRAIASIRARSSGRAVQIVIIDNGSTQAEARALLTELRGSPDILVLDDATPFNFSAMCNRGAAAANGEVLVFLNDDTEVLSDGWLDRLAAHALDGSVGAVGAKLTYPDGRLQHIGVVVGMGGSAGHFGSLVPGDDPGWLGRNEVVHEVSAVTGACLAVARQKFEAVGGFDAEHLPVELSDIDLCLKLNARGWQTIVDPLVHLMHEESASRGGATFRRLDIYGEQRQVFIDRWRHVLRDDPFFHPGLSLYWWQAALG